MGFGQTPQPDSSLWRHTQINVLDLDVQGVDDERLATWAAFLPIKPSTRGLHFGWTEKGKERRAKMRQWPSESASRRNAAALELRLHQEGWLDATVQPRWVGQKRGAKLILDVSMGQRWIIDGVRWKVGASGLPLGALQRVAQLNEGMPMEMGRLVDAQERMAAWAQSHGYATVHSGLIKYELDTLGKSKGRLAILGVEISPWNPGGMPWMSGVNDTLRLVPRQHPLVRMGQVRWDGEVPGLTTEYADLRAEVWRHAVDFSPGESFKPEKVSRAYRGLTDLKMFSRVNVAQSLRWDTAAKETEVGLPGAVVMDVNFLVDPKETHDIAVELDFIRNDARYGPQLGITMLRHNARGWGGENAWFAGFGYVAVAPFANFNREGLLNSGEWSISWQRSRVGIPPIPLGRLLTSASPITLVEFGWDREIWPEFTRSQIHAKHDFSFTENPSKNSVIHVSLIDVSLVNLSNRSASFVDWLENQENPLVVARFNNHATLGSSLSWERRWTLGAWEGGWEVQASWAGGMAQMLATRRGPGTLLFDDETGAWMVVDGVPVVQYGRGMLGFHGVKSTHWHRLRQAFNVRFGAAQAGKNTPSLPLEQSFFTGGANGIRGWTIRALGPGNLETNALASAIQGVGDIRVDLQHEWRFQVDESWQPAWFVDAGNVWLHGEDAPDDTRWKDGGWNSIALSTGLGLRYDLEFFVARIDAGLRIHDPSAPTGTRWLGQGDLKGAIHLGLGLPF